MFQRGPGEAREGGRGPCPRRARAGVGFCYFGHSGAGGANEVGAWVFAGTGGGGVSGESGLGVNGRGW